MNNTIFITGANRGIGLEFAIQYLALGWHVIASCRAPQHAIALNNLLKQYPNSLQIYTLDVTQPSQIDAVADKLHNVTIDILLNNAGIYGPLGLSLGNVPMQPWLQAFTTNAIAPFLVAQALVENVARSERKIIANISSLMASIADNQSGAAYIYRSSKTALNAVMKSLALDLLERNISVVLLNPGWVKTDMGGSNATMSVQQSVSHLIKVLDMTNIQSTGSFINYDGDLLSW